MTHINQYTANYKQLGIGLAHFFKAYFLPKKIGNNLLLSSLLLLHTACFELKEEISFNKDGSGHFRLVADFSANKAVLDELLHGAAASEYPTFGEEGKPLEQLAKVWEVGATDLNLINGISHAREIADYQEYVFGMEFDFADVQALNLVLSLKDRGAYNPNYQPAYSFKKGEAIKYNLFSFHKLLALLQENAEEDSPAHLEKQKKAIFAQIRYQCVIEVAGKVKKYSNKAFRISENRRRLVLSASLPTVIDGKTDIGNEIRFK